MPVKFPHKPEVRLANPPLVEVVCQIKFPPILRISKDDPSEFQERVRHRFPRLEVEHGILIQMPPVESSGVPVTEPQNKVYRFLTADGQTVTSLTTDFYALSTKKYIHWEHFIQDLSLVHEAIVEIYKPSYLTRIGLRYINRLTRSNTKCSKESELIGFVRPELATLLQVEVWTQPAEVLSRVLIPDGDARLNLRTRYGKDNEEPFFVLDFDYFEEGDLNLEGLVARCNRYHEVIYAAFRWCLRDDKLDVFKPVAREAIRP